MDSATLTNLLRSLFATAVREAVGVAVEDALQSALPEVIRRARLPEYLSRAEAANYLGVSVRKLDSLRSSPGRLPYSKRGGRVMLRTADLDAYLDVGRVAAQDTRRRGA